MSRTINRIELLGRVGTEPELRQTRNGTAVCRLRLATERRNSGGEKPDRLAQPGGLGQDRRSGRRVRPEG